MVTIAQRVFATARIGVPARLPRVGTALKSRFVYHDSALEIQALVAHGEVEIVDERRRRVDDGELIADLQFVRRR